MEQGRKACVQKSDFCTKKVIITLCISFRQFRISGLTPIDFRTSLDLSRSLSPRKRSYPFCSFWCHLPWHFCNSFLFLPQKTIVFILSCPDRQLDSFASFEESLARLFMLSFHDWWCQHIQAVDIPAIHLCLDALGHCNFTRGFKEVQVKSGTGLEQIHSYFKLELSGESLKLLKW